MSAESAKALPLVSATQVTLFRECARKWGWRYLEGLKTPQHPAAALGTEIDDTQLQPYLREGRPIDFTRESGYIAASGLAYLPQPKTLNLEVQKHFVLPAPSKLFGFQGYIDLWLPAGGLPLNEQDGTPNVVDFKSTSNFKYAKTEKQLAKDVQAQLYARWALDSTGSKKVDLDWIYFATRGPRKAKKTHLRVVSDQVAEQFSAINETAETMFSVRKAKPNPIELEPNPDMCEAYGGCPYRDKCALTLSNSVDAMAAAWARQTEDRGMSNANDTSGLLARLKAQRDAQGVASAPPPVAAPAPVAVVGINPPESTLPPAPPVGAAIAPSAPPPVEAAPAKRAPARPRAAKAEAKDPIAADANAFTTPNTPKPEESTSVVVNVSGPDTLPEQSVTVTWAEETISPVAYNTFKVGPFTATGTVRKGETIPQACGRLYSELAAFAEQARAAKAAIFKGALEKMGVGARQ